MAVINRIRPFLWTQIRNVCVFARIQISAISNWQLANSKPRLGEGVSL